MAQSRKPSLLLIVCVVGAALLAGFELAAPWINGKRPDWVVVALCGLIVVWFFVVRPLLLMGRKTE